MGQKKVAVLILALLAILVFGAWQLLALQSKGQVAAAITIDIPLILHHKIQGSTHMYDGIVSLASSCDTLSNGISTEGVDPAHIKIHVSAGSVVCADAIKTQADFSVSFTGSGTTTPVIDAVIFNGMEIPHTLVEDQ